LISKNTEKSIWIRHILDSAQIIKLIDESKDHNIVDLGSGAGFPGLIIAFYNENVRFHVKLYEKSPVKRAFLINIKEKLDIKNIDIENDVYEKKKILADVIVCRAFKKLSEILNISRETVKKPHKLIILKGKNAQSEINNVSLGSNYSYKIEKSITDDNSKIIIVDVK
jgi:16S rRNA (guanine527-N7)-methyltransferase